MSTTSTEIKTVGKSGQISLGKGYAGKTLRLQRQSDGSIVLTPVAVIPESQLWTLQEPHRSAIERGMAWAAENPPAETDLDELLTRRSRRTEAKQPRGSSK
ncbi:MAG TPA: hypothetical protein VKM72_03820 [Thermoanaerobaculia bacterium]|nr:hypothetical protein [Thermoanaerobaculia bacterium]